MINPQSIRTVLFFLVSCSCGCRVSETALHDRLLSSGSSDCYQLVCHPNQQTCQTVYHQEKRRACKEQGNIADGPRAHQAYRHVGRRPPRLGSKIVYAYSHPNTLHFFFYSTADRRYLPFFPPQPSSF